MNNKQMTTEENGSLNKMAQTGSTYRQTPAVDIFETSDELILLADLPGVEEQGLQIEVSRGVLTLEAEKASEGAVKTTYYRQFKLSERIAADAGEAALKDGVLTLRLPKSAEAKPKKIAVKTLH
ncbi:MAG: Hsp20/alpha crystallin family protein [Desulfuromonadales bacterium]|nr:Hsp20/alpha crystallin family protein [Desulfuromonadales bacterium]